MSASLSHNTVKPTFVQAREYFQFRLNQENSLKQFKANQHNIKLAHVVELKKHDGVSLKRINAAITVFKKYAPKDKLSVYDFIINGLDRSFVRHYEDHKGIIIDYIEICFSLADSLKTFRNKSKKAYTDFKKDIVIDLSLLNLSYVNFKATLDTFNTMNISSKEFIKAKAELFYLNDIADEFFIKCVRDIELVRHHLNLEQHLADKNKQVYAEEIRKMFNQSKKESQEDEIKQILLAMGV